MPLTLRLSSDILVGVLLITTGVFTFARGTSQHLADNDFKKSKDHIEKLLNTVQSSNITIHQTSQENNDQD